MRPRSRCPACPRKKGTTAETISERNTSSTQKYTFSRNGAREISKVIEAATINATLRCKIVAGQAAHKLADAQPADIRKSGRVTRRTAGVYSFR